MDSFLTPEQEAASPNTSHERLEELAYESDDLDLLIAQNLQTPAKLLKGLAGLYKASFRTRKTRRKSDTAILRAITANPNTSLELLLILGEYFPKQMLDNPVFNLLLLENPNLVDDIPINTLKSILKLKKVPSFLNQAILSDKKYIQIAQIVEKNSKISISLFILESMTHHANLSVRHAVARNPNLPINLLEILAQDSDWMVRKQVARNPKTPSSILQILAQDVNKWVRCEVAKNSKTSSSVLQILAQDADSEVCTEVMKNPHTPISVLENFAQGSNAYFRIIAQGLLHRKSNTIS